jgi:hypothetical protein
VFAGSEKEKLFFSARITDMDGEKYLVSELSTGDPHMYYHFQAKKGSASVRLEFSNVSSVKFTGPCGNPSKGWRTAQVVLVNGKVQEFYINGGYVCGGNNVGRLYCKDKELNSDIEIDLGEIDTIQFQPRGTFSE